MRHSKYYTKKNMGWEYTKEEHEQWQLAERGGAQGDYREGMPEKIENVIDCLKTEPFSKRAIIPIPFAEEPSSKVDWTNQGQTKCCRELHFYLEDGKLKCTGIVRMQNANIFVKNIHFFATLIDHVAKALDVPVGEYTHFITVRTLCVDNPLVAFHTVRWHATSNVFLIYPIYPLLRMFASIVAPLLARSYLCIAASDRLLVVISYLISSTQVTFQYYYTL